MIVLIVVLSGVLCILVWMVVKLSRTITRMTEEQKTKDQLYQIIVQHEREKQGPQE